MSFSSEAKAELCQARPDKKCDAVAECYGVLMYCNTFAPGEIRIITASDAFAARLPRLFRPVPLSWKTPMGDTMERRGAGKI